MVISWTEVFPANVARPGQAKHSDFGIDIIKCFIAIAHQLMNNCRSLALLTGLAALFLKILEPWMIAKHVPCNSVNSNLDRFNSVKLVSWRLQGNLALYQLSRPGVLPGNILQEAAGKGSGERFDAPLEGLILLRGLLLEFCVQLSCDKLVHGLGHAWKRCLDAAQSDSKSHDLARHSTDWTATPAIPQLLLDRRIHASRWEPSPWSCSSCRSAESPEKQVSYFLSSRSSVYHHHWGLTVTICVRSTGMFRHFISPAQMLPIECIYSGHQDSYQSLLFRLHGRTRYVLVTVSW